MGETYFGPEAVEAYIHESVAPRLVGHEALAISKHSRDLSWFYVTHGGTGVSARAHSAVDIALWDIFGKTMGQPLHQLLGGRVRDRCRVYNTCAGYRYGRETAVGRGTSRPQPHPSAGVVRATPPGPYEDLLAFQHDAGKLAQSLLDDGITAMKIWPFDGLARETDGQAISLAQLKAALVPFEKVRAAVGDEMEVMVELHGLWRAGPAERICQALEAFEPLWVEDAVTLNDLEGVRRLRATSNVRLAFGESLGSVHDFKRLCDTGGVDVLLFDPTWSGGVSAGRKADVVAELYGIDLSPHDCVGPIGLTVGAHLSLSARSIGIQEVVRAYYTGWYNEIITGLPYVEDGYITVGDRPGLGVQWQPGLWDREDAHVVSTGDPDR